MRVDVNTFVGEYPSRRVPGGTPDALLDAMDRCGIDEAWVSHLGAAFWRDPTEGNNALFALAASRPRLRAVPAVHPGLPPWERVLEGAVAAEAPCVRCDPTRYGLDPIGAEVRALAAATAAAGRPLLLAVRFEDARQRHPNDTAPDLPPSAVRTLLRVNPRVRLIVTHADRDFIEEVHFGSTPEEAARVLWDISWIWGPPEDHLALLLETIGVGRFAFGTGMPLRLPDASVAKLDLLDLDPADRSAIEEANVTRFLAE